MPALRTINCQPACTRACLRHAPYANERVWPVAFAAAVTIGSSGLPRLASAAKPALLNPSNFALR
jgi:hypothetical protein